MLSGIDVRGSRRVWTVVLVSLAVVASTATVVTAAPAHVSVSSMSVSDDEPKTGDTITVTPTVRHSSSGSGSFEVTQVTLEDASGTRYAEAEDLGTLGAGDTIDVPLRTTVQSAGEKTFVVHIRGIQYDADGKWKQVVHTKHPTHVTVSEPSTPTETKPQLNVDADSLAAGTESTVRVTVSNGGDDRLTDLSLQLSGLGGMENRTRLQPALGATNSTTFEFDVRPPEAGTYPLNATLEYGDGNAVEASENVEVAPLRTDATVYATVAEENDSTVLQYRVTNHGNAPLENVVVSGAAVGTPFPTAVIQTVEPGTSATATVEVNDRPTGAATVSATYSTGSTTGQADRAIQFGESASATATASATQQADATETNANRDGTFWPLSLLAGGVVATGSILGYRSWRGIR